MKKNLFFVSVTLIFFVFLSLASQYYSCFVTPFSPYQMYDIISPIFDNSPNTSNFFMRQEINTGSNFSYLEYPNYSSLCRSLSLEHSINEISTFSLFHSNNTCMLYIKEVTTKPISIASTLNLGVFDNQDEDFDELLFGSTLLTSSNSIYIPFSYVDPLLSFYNLKNVESLIGQEVTVVNRYYSSLFEKKFVISGILEPKVNGNYYQIVNSLGGDVPIVTLGNTFNSPSGFATLIYKKNKPIIIDFLSKVHSFLSSNFDSFLDQTNSYGYFVIYDNYTDEDQIELINTNLQNLCLFLTRDNTLFIFLGMLGFWFYILAYLILIKKSFVIDKKLILSFIISGLFVLFVTSIVLSFVTSIYIYELHVPLVRWLGFIIYLFSFLLILFLLIRNYRRNVRCLK